MRDSQKFDLGVTYFVRYGQKAMRVFAFSSASHALYIWRPSRPSHMSIYASFDLSFVPSSGPVKASSEYCLNSSSSDVRLSDCQSKQGTVKSGVELSPC